MGWLAKAVSIITKIVAIGTGLDPVLKYVLPPSAQGAEQKIQSELVSIAGEITNIEAVYQAVVGTAGGGPAKLKAAIPYISKIILSSEMMIGKKVADEAKFEAAVAAVTSGFADLLNSLDAQ